MYVRLVAKDQKDVKICKVGWSWTTYFFGPFVPLFRLDFKFFFLFLLLLPLTWLGTLWTAHCYNRWYIQGLLNKGYRPYDQAAELTLMQNGFMFTPGVPKANSAEVASDAPFDDQSNNNNNIDQPVVAASSSQEELNESIRNGGITTKQYIIVAVAAILLCGIVGYCFKTFYYDVKKSTPNEPITSNSQMVKEDTQTVKEDNQPTAQAGGSSVSVNSQSVPVMSTFYGREYAALNGSVRYDSNTTEITDYVAGAIIQYETKLVEAINSGNFSIVAPFITPNSALYKQQKKLVQNLSHKKIKEEFVTFEFNCEVAPSDNHIASVIYTKHKIMYSNGTEKYVDNFFLYTIDTRNGQIKSLQANGDFFEERGEGDPPIHEGIVNVDNSECLNVRIGPSKACRSIGYIYTDDSVVIYSGPITQDDGNEWLLARVPGYGYAWLMRPYVDEMDSF